MTDSPNIQIRVATLDDRTAMMPAINQAFGIEKFLEGTRTDEARLAEMMKSGEFLIAQNGSGKIVASVYIEIKGDRGYLGMLAVDPAEQGKGLGRVMVDAVEDYCRKKGCSAVDLVVISLRTDLPPFYRKLGYVETGIEEFHPSRKLKPGVECHCIVMSKEFLRQAVIQFRACIAAPSLLQFSFFLLRSVGGRTRPISVSSCFRFT